MAFGSTAWPSDYADSMAADGVGLLSITTGIDRAPAVPKGKMTEKDKGLNPILQFLECAPTPNRRCHSAFSASRWALAAALAAAIRSARPRGASQIVQRVIEPYSSRHLLTSRFAAMIGRAMKISHRIKQLKELWDWLGLAWQIAGAFGLTGIAVAAVSGIWAAVQGIPKPFIHGRVLCLGGDIS